MINPFAKLPIVLFAISAAVLIFSQSFFAKPALSEISATRSLTPSTVSSTLVATAEAPPNLQRAVLGGEPVYVLYVTRNEDNVLVRCYPGYEPTIAVRAMGSNPNATNVQKEGVMTCRLSSPAS
ncbi:MAG: hypothetical protein DCF15_09590 [Phormidesmis priestleyi]|uniref:Uncharacterized protein n=1 Tax=Phormidesmis priestleyi TaxID=268141 RepID=A0A2W4XFJ9_9CYAN|nr:MAG: hypothetical protein DCF15_09590 [Phormidesmis priestleyi]